MKNIHSKSPCCSAKINSFGKRRKQCSLCRKTWTIRPRKRGRHPKRITTDLLKKVIQDSQSIKFLSRRLSISEQALSYRFRQELRCFTKKPLSLCFPSGPLIIIVDGLWFRFQGQLWTLYLGAIKSCQSQQACFLDPLLLQGRENLPDWKLFFQSIPEPIKYRIKALVADNFRGAKNLAKENDWILQLCHFHLICHLQARRGRRRFFSQSQIREEIYQLIRQALELPEGQRFNQIIQRLTSLQEMAPSKGLKMIVREFMRNISYYRAYQKYSKLGLPSTTNSVEAMGRKLRKLMIRLGNLRTPQSLNLWAIAYVRMHPEIKCNCKKFQQN